MMRLNRKGSTMMEAAVVFPLVILSVTTVVFMLGFLFQETACKARLHVAVNAAAGNHADTVETYRNVPETIQPYAEHAGLRKGWFAEETLNAEPKGLLTRRLIRTKVSRAYEINETRYLRLVDLVTD